MNCRMNWHTAEHFSMFVRDASLQKRTFGQCMGRNGGYLSIPQNLNFPEVDVLVSVWVFDCAAKWNILSSPVDR